jgi:hypothetical protein
MPPRLWRRLLLVALCWLATFLGLRLVVAPTERCPDVTTASLRAGVAEAVGWYQRNEQPDGRWLYEYDANTGTDLGGYNTVRHAGAIMGLYQAATTGTDGAVEAGDHGLAWALERLVERDGWSALGDETQLSTGATALLAAGLVDRRAATGDGQYDDEMRAFGRFLAAQTEPSGAVLAFYDSAAGQPVPDSYSKYYTGETYWALARLHSTFPDDGFGEVADRIGAYVAAERDRTEGFGFPGLPDHWAGYGLAETVTFPERAGPRPLTDDEIAYAKDQMGLFGSSVRWVAQEAAGRPGSMFRPGGPLRGGGYGVVGEALTGHWRLTHADERLAGLEPAVSERALCVAGLLVAKQVLPGQSQGYPVDDRTQGAWFRDGNTRMDDTQHALAVLVRSIPILEAGEPHGDRDPQVAWWLLVAALVAAVNPLRAALGVPLRARRARTGLAALGGLAAVAAYAAGAAVAAGLLDVLDINEPVARLAAGIAIGVAGIADLVRGRPSPEPALPGRWAALVPVAVPFVLRPAAAVLVLSAGADLGAQATVLGAALAAALVVSAVAAGLGEVPPGDDASRRSRFALVPRALGVLALTCGIALVWSGAFAV